METVTLLVGDGVLIGGGVRVVLTGLAGGRVRLGVETTPWLPIMRHELLGRPRPEPHGCGPTPADLAAIETEEGHPS